MRSTGTTNGIGQGKSKGGNIGFEAELLKAADKLRGNMKPSDYKHVALGLVFLKYISDAFEAHRATLLIEDAQAAEDKDEYLADNIFWVPTVETDHAICSSEVMQFVPKRPEDRPRHFRPHGCLAYPGYEFLSRSRAGSKAKGLLMSGLSPRRYTAGTAVG